LALLILPAFLRNTSLSEISGLHPSRARFLETIPLKLGQNRRCIFHTMKEISGLRPIRGIFPANP